ncbi:MAG: TetR family transcriptional regulator [Patulibacter sp.]
MRASSNSAPSPSAKPPTRRERKRAEAKAKVAEIGIALFAERGFANVSVDEICDAAGVAPRSFFRYFPAKADLLLEPVIEMTQQLEAAIAAAPAQDDNARVLRDAFRQLATYVLEHWERLSLFFVASTDAGAASRSPLIHLTDRERMLTDLLRQRDASPPLLDWQLRLLVARTLAAFRVWLEDVRMDRTTSPLDHLETILQAK